MNTVINRLKNDLTTEEARYAYADSATNTFVTGQIKALREARGLTQERLAELVGTKQSGISRWQSTGYAGCKVETLRKFAKAFGVRLRISFEEFGTLPTDIDGFSNARLCPRKFEDDPVFKESGGDEAARRSLHSAVPEAQIRNLVGAGALGRVSIALSEEAHTQLSLGDKGVSVAANALVGPLGKSLEATNLNRLIAAHTAFFLAAYGQNATPSAPSLKSTPPESPVPRKEFGIVPKRPAGGGISNPLLTEKLASWP